MLRRLIDLAKAELMTAIDSPSPLVPRLNEMISLTISFALGFYWSAFDGRNVLTVSDVVGYFLISL